MSQIKFQFPRNVGELICKFADLSTHEKNIPEDIDSLALISSVNRDRAFGMAVESQLDQVYNSTMNGGNVLLQNANWLKRYLYPVPLSASVMASKHHEYLQAAWTRYCYEWPVSIPSWDDDGNATTIVVHPGFNANEILQNNLMCDASFGDDPNVLTIVRPIGRSLVSHDNLDDRSRTVALRRATIMSLKAWIALWIIQEKISFVVAQNVMDDMVYTNKYAALLASIVAMCLQLWFAVVKAVCGLYNSFNMKWYFNLMPELQAMLDITGVFFVLWVIYSLTKRVERPYKVNASKKGNQFLGQLADSRGIVYRVRIDGKEYELQSEPKIETHVEEMSMPGSEYFPCRNQPIGAILVATDDKDLQIFGTFWRLDDYLVTARHCSNTLAQSTATVYLATLRQTKKSNWEIDRSQLFKADKDFFNPENNATAHYDVDVFATELDQKLWAQIRVQKANVRVRSAYNQQVHSVGFTTNGLLVSASGKTLPDSGYELLHHTASTQKGFSGSIVLCGSSVIGMHVSAAGDHNVAVRVEMIQYLIDEGVAMEAKTKNKKYTYANASYKEFYRENKWRGGIVDLKQMRNGQYSVLLQNGEATYGWDINELATCFGRHGNLEKDFDDLEDMLFSKKSNGRYITFDDEPRGNRLRHECVSCALKPVKAGKRIRHTKPVVKEEDKIYDVTEGLRKIHGPSADTVQPQILKVIENNKDEIVNLGYVEGEFVYPEMNYEVERNSLIKHLDLFADRLKTVTMKGVDRYVSRAAGIVAEMCVANTFEPASDYKEVSGIMNIINSSMVNPSRAAGFPYVEQGLPLNGDVLKQFGERGFAQHVLNEWLSEYTIKIFNKGEPTKQKKIKNGMPRIITNLPLHKTVKHMSIFQNLQFACTRNWKSSPIKFAFAPAEVGHLEHLKEVLPGKCYESDKSNWDFMFYDYIADGVKQAIKLLAVKPAAWNEEQFDAYLADIDQAFDEVFNECSYRTSDGTLFKMNKNGIMKSGWFMTIVVNSFAQLFIHVLVLVIMGYDDDYIKAQPIFVGGDDVNQDLQDVDVKRYTEIAASLGVEMEIHERDNLESSEYFSSDIRVVNGKMAFFPKRWTKHIEHLKTIKVENLASALSSHMLNYRHDPAKFAVLEKMYDELRVDYPDQFPLQFKKSRRALVSQQYGYEFFDC